MRTLAQIIHEGVAALRAQLGHEDAQRFIKLMAGEDAGPVKEQLNAASKELPMSAAPIVKSKKAPTERSTLRSFHTKKRPKR